MEGFPKAQMTLEVTVSVIEMFVTYSPFCAANALSASAAGSIASLIMLPRFPDRVADCTTFTLANSTVSPQNVASSTATR